MAARKNVKKQKSIILRAGFIVFIVYAVVTLIGLQSQLITARAALREQQAKNSATAITNTELAKLINSGTTNDFIERAARDKLGYVYPNEIVFEATK